MSFNPCIPKEWEEFEIKYKFGESIYNIKVKNQNRKNSGVSTVVMNGEVVENNIKLDGTGKIFNIEVEM